jgi:hypothetical protein
MTRFAAAASWLVVSACVAAPELAADQRELAVPRGTGVDVAVTLDDRPVAFDELVWLVDDPTIVRVGRTSDGTRLRVTGALEGDTTVHLGARGEVIDLPAHVAPPAIVQLWIEPVEVSAPVGASVAVRATALDTTSTLRDVSDATTWQLMDPGVATLRNNAVLAANAGHTTLQAVLAGVQTTAAVTVY